ncbi:hypothetical protein VNI00_017315 [Paramarasmius palmivorus]|uniref:Uncharacterized protein n=1 Tax=Paramarasmius palmivorus TaxID=297713 RepID=A0AAW0B7H9_9AGAR
MPWAKVRKSQATRRQENREKSARHYARHRQQILARKKAARDLLAKRAEAEWAGRKGESTVRGGDSIKPIGTLSSATQLTRISKALNRYTKGRPSQFLEALYKTYIQEELSNPSNASQTNSTLTAAEDTISDLLSSCYRLENDILQEGAYPDFNEVHTLTKRIKCILDCVLNMEMMVMDPEENLEKAYSDKRLDFQKVQIQQWINGVEAVPE